MKKLFNLLIKVLIPAYILFRLISLNLLNPVSEEQHVSITTTSAILPRHHVVKSEPVEERFDPAQNRIAFFHIQKTSGTNFDSMITRNMLILDRRTGKWKTGCERKVNSKKPLRQRASRVEKNASNRFVCKTGLDSKHVWYLGDSSEFGYQCGLHSYFTDFKACVNKRYTKGRVRAHFITILREPVERYVSEYLHTLKYFRKKQNPWIFKPPLNQDHVCINKKIWSCQFFWRGLADFNITSFMACNESLGVNRMTRMLAQYDQRFTLCDTLPSDGLVNETSLLERAKSSLMSLKFFGLADRQQESMKLMEATFDNAIKFNLSSLKTIQKSARSTLKMFRKLSKETLEQVKLLNHLDIQLFSFAKELFSQRLNQMKIL